MALSMSADPSRSSRTLLDAANPNLPLYDLLSGPSPGWRRSASPSRRRRDGRGAAGAAC